MVRIVFLLRGVINMVLLLFCLKICYEIHTKFYVTCRNIPLVKRTTGNNVSLSRSSRPIAAALAQSLGIMVFEHAAGCFAPPGRAAVNADEAPSFANPPGKRDCLPAKSGVGLRAIA